MKKIFLITVLIFSIFRLEERYAFSYDKQEVRRIIEETERYITKKFVDRYGSRFELQSDIIIDNNYLLKRSESFKKLKEITKKSWEKIISDIEYVAPTENAKTILFQAAQYLKREEYIKFLLKLIDKTREGVVSYQQFDWATVPYTKHLRYMWADDLYYPELPELVKKVREVFAKDKNKERAKVIIKFFEDILKRRMKEELECLKYSRRNFCEVEFLQWLRRGKDPLTQLRVLRKKISFDEKDKDFNKRMEFFLKGVKIIAEGARSGNLKQRGKVVEELLKIRKKLLETKPITYRKIVIDEVIRSLICGIIFEVVYDKDEESIKAIKKALIEFNKANYYTPDLIARIFKEEMGLDFKTKGKTIYDIFEECMIRKKILKNYDKNEPLLENINRIRRTKDAPKMVRLRELLRKFDLYSFIFLYCINDFDEYLSQVAIELSLRKIDIMGDIKETDIMRAIENLKTRVRLEDIYKITTEDLMEFKKLNKGNNEKCKINQKKVDKTIFALRLIKNDIKYKNWHKTINLIIDYINSLKETHN